MDFLNEGKEEGEIFCRERNMRFGFYFIFIISFLDFTLREIESGFVGGLWVAFSIVWFLLNRVSLCLEIMF